VKPRNAAVAAAHRVDTELLARSLGATSIVKASPQLVRSATDQAIGGVAPTGHPKRLRTIVDETLCRYSVLWTAAGTPDSVMPMTYAQLLTITEGVAMQVR
jgi:prolyl-tRNA editing enzyme YbaK/EbsC (Cys-tRNA(Pro) deacylase)